MSINEKVVVLIAEIKGRKYQNVSKSNDFGNLRLFFNKIDESFRQKATVNSTTSGKSIDTIKSFKEKFSNMYFKIRLKNTIFLLLYCW